jgi:hypothetical protein
MLAEVPGLPPMTPPPGESFGVTPLERRLLQTLAIVLAWDMNPPSTNGEQLPTSFCDFGGTDDTHNYFLAIVRDG